MDTHTAKWVGMGGGVYDNWVAIKQFKNMMSVQWPLCRQVLLVHSISPNHFGDMHV